MFYLVIQPEETGFYAPNGMNAMGRNQVNGDVKVDVDVRAPEPVIHHSAATNHQRKKDAIFRCLFVAKEYSILG